MDRGAWWAILHAVTKSQIQLSVCMHARADTHTIHIAHYDFFAYVEVDNHYFSDEQMIVIF